MYICKKYSTQMKNSANTQVSNVVMLFDFDGTLMNTEHLYTPLWDDIGHRFLHEDNFGLRIKGQSLKRVYAEYFAGRTEAQDHISALIDHLEEEMPYEYIPGARDFLEELHAHHIPTAIVTSSLKKKMGIVARKRPELNQLITRVLTADMFTKSKPDPECFLLAMHELGGVPRRTVVFEDSASGLKAARASGAFVVGLATTLPRTEVEKLADLAIDDFTQLSLTDVIQRM